MEFFMVTLSIFSDKKGEINKFLSKFYNTSLDLDNNLSWEKEYNNPIELADIIGTYIDNSDDFKLNLLVSLDKDIYINITENNADLLIRYLFERYPY